MNNKAFHIECSCGATIRSEHIHGSIVYCAKCRTYKVLEGQSSLQPVFYKILRFDHDRHYYLELLLDYICKNGDEKAFNKMKVIKDLQCIYVPVREIGTGQNRFYVPLNTSDEKLKSYLFPKGELPVSLYGDALREADTKDLNVNDFKPIYAVSQSKKTEFLPINVSIEKLDAIYGINSEDLLVVKYLPVFILETNKCKFVCIGHNEKFHVVNQEEVDKAIKPNHQKWDKWAILYLIGAFVACVGILLLIGGIIALVYTLFTSGHFWSILLNIIGYGLFAVWCAIWLGLYALAIIITFAPVVMFFICLLSRTPKEKVPNRRKGRKVLGLS